MAEPGGARSSTSCRDRKPLGWEKSLALPHGSSHSSTKVVVAPEPATVSAGSPKNARKCASISAARAAQAAAERSAFGGPIGGSPSEVPTSDGGLLIDESAIDNAPQHAESPIRRGGTRRSPICHAYAVYGGVRAGDARLRRAHCRRRFVACVMSDVIFVTL
eukprot:COSAG03_NODE_2580_length_2622_cov_1.093391_2_plen_162_part_00